ncbi:MAG: peptidase M56, partial [Lachnospiraceae bacterium]|nr:peptidase M56 [Lachnospiraceae bacterium]
MSGIFLKLLNMSITASWLILAVIMARLLLRKAPKWVPCVLWGLVAVRLICPFSLKSVFSLIPSSETVPS